MKFTDIAIQERKRRWALAFIMLIGFVILLVSLWQMQVGESKRYEASLEYQSIRRIRIPGVRGMIFDRNNVCLVENEPNYCIAIYLEEIRRSGRRVRMVDEAWKVIRHIADLIGKEPDITKAQIERHIFSRRLLPLLAWENIGERGLARFSEHSINLPGVDIVVRPMRHYSRGFSACHLLGYVGSVETREEKTDYHHFYMPDMEGRRGIEKHYDTQLAGIGGGTLVRVDVSGFKHEEIGRREPEFGNDLMLAIDLRIQQIAERALADNAGSVVVLNPNNGDVLAMVSSPGFDLRTFYPSMSHKTWNKLRDDPRLPLLNRAVSGLYPPGSIFKPVVAMAMLEKMDVNINKKYVCEGYIQVGNEQFQCYRKTAHGEIGFKAALELSCNVFFYKLGMEYGYDSIYDTALEMGFGQKTGVDIEYELAGLLPGREWIRRKMGHSWRIGDTCNISIGQGALVVTPLQMAVVVAAIANEGRVYQPRLLIGSRAPGAQGFEMIPPKLIRDLNWSSKNIKVVKDGMRAVVQERSGTGHQAYLSEVVMGGKTGTAQYGRKEERKNHGWMMLFAPFDNPRYAVVMMMDEAVSGGASVGPRVSRMMKEIFMLEAGKEST